MRIREKKEIRKQVIEIQKRFFQAIDLLIASKQIRGLKTFCTTYKLNRTRYSDIRNHVINEEGIGYKTIDLDAVSYLVKDFGFSAEWLLTGQGGIYANKSQKTEVND